ncbi:uncharacterized protein BT62DRAFT_1010906 [Guyanagaster necrorhizus]|uniref:RNA-dependent RNA polymerase n=1 Tax=Guyanagaster necrorhizus TaxID=856835 RepID=A0A9P7VKA5_9AGAR|nr:uncharacterized protein BT62DRAFT_1010906 [Guyanagaster necrorhizus MCA 3950]KAG7442133.1 hypothetical protein BT62DRAFT_1010906 [Guyanagaster necrorhizus MCA 3950]
MPSAFACYPPAWDVTKELTKVLHSPEFHRIDNGRLFNFDVGFEQVGGILKEGFELAGRRFEFLAYSSSALREHSVWFINPFEYQHPNTKEMVWISAFTSTNPSITIQRNQWAVVEDLGLKPYLHTDGAGTISECLDDEIWERLHEGCRDYGENVIKPSGVIKVIAVEPRLDDNPIRMRLRPSMGKFEDSRSTETNIEIANYFNKPMLSYLNSDSGDKRVRREVFYELQDDAVANALTIDDSMQQLSNILEKNSLGSVYRLSYIIHQLLVLSLDIRTPGIDTPFLKDYQLVGVPDEGPAYEKEGHKNLERSGEADYTYLSYLLDRPIVLEARALNRMTSLPTYPLTDPLTTTKISEAEVVVGAILDKCSSDRARRDRISCMGDQASQAVMRQGLLPYEGEEDIATKQMSRAGLKCA